MNRPFLHYSRQFIDEKDIEAVTRVLKGDFLTTGPEVDRLEKKIASEVGAKFCVVCSSATAALHLAAAALDIGPGSALVTTPITFVATSNAARFCGGGVYLSDINPRTANLDPVALKELLKSNPTNNGKIKAIFPVHMAGQAADMEEIFSIARTLGLRIVEDASHALGSTYKTSSGETVKVGSCRHSDMAIFSFHPVKPITTGEGGAITTNDEALYLKLRKLRAHGIERDPAHWTNEEAALDERGSPNPWYYEMQELGWNYRISDIQCALGCAQLEKLPWIVEKRNAIASRYYDLLSKSALSDLVRPLANESGGVSSYHLYVAQIDFQKLGITRAQLMNELREKGIGTQVNYIPIHYQPYYRDYFGNNLPKLPFAEKYYESTLSLPISAGMRLEDVDYVVQSIEQFARLK